jgi:hypothetical protein
LSFDQIRHGERRAAADAGFIGIGLHADDLSRMVASGLVVAGMQAVLAETGRRVVEIEFLGGWALEADPSRSVLFSDRLTGRRGDTLPGPR